MKLSSTALNNRYPLTLWQLFILTFCQLFNHWMDRSLKIFAVYIHTDLGISLSTLSYVLTFGSYGPVIVFLSSHFYHYFQSNILLFIMELTGAITMLLIYCYGYKIVWLLFVCRLFFSSSIKGIFTYTNTMVAYYITDKQDTTIYISIFNSAFVCSTFLFIATGELLNKNNGLFRYLLIYCLIAFSFSVMLVMGMPKTKTESLNVNLETRFLHKISELFCNNIRYIALLWICFFEQISQSVFDISIGVFIKKNYNANTLDLGLYTTLTQGIGQLIGIVCIAFIFGKYIKQKYFIFIFAAFEFIVYVIFYALIHNDSEIYIVSCLCIMFIISLGHMGLYYGLVIILIKTIPKHQQSVGSAIWSVIDIVGGSLGTFTVGKIAKRNPNDVYLYSMILFIVYCFTMISVIVWCLLSSKNDDEKGETDTVNLLAIGKVNYNSVNTVELQI